MINIQEIKEIYRNRHSSKAEEWIKLKSEFIEEGLYSLIDEQCESWMFHVVYFKIVNISDKEIYHSLIEESQ